MQPEGCFGSVVLLQVYRIRAFRYLRICYFGLFEVGMENAWRQLTNATGGWREVMVNGIDMDRRTGYLCECMIIILL